MSVSFGGIGELAVTFMADETVSHGMPVKMGMSGTVTACGDGERFCGIAHRTSGDGYATVLLGGFVTAPYSGSVPDVGFVKLAADSAGGVKVTVGEGSEVLVAEVDEAAKTVGFYM